MHGRSAGLLAALAAVLSIALPSGAAAHTKSVTLHADERYRGYEIKLRALKEDEEPVRISVILQNGVQTHRYEFDAPRTALTFGRNLRSGTLELRALSGRAAQALAVGYGGGTIAFAASGPMRVVECSGGRATKSRPQVRTGGRLRFSPTRQAEDEVTRKEWTGTARELVFGGCARPITCNPAARLSAHKSEGSNTYGVMAWRYRSGGSLKVEGTYFEIDPEGPAVFVVHTRTTQASRSRFSVTGLSHGTVDLDGVSGFDGSFEVDGEGEPLVNYPPCPARLKEGAAEGTVSTKFRFVPDQTASSWSGGMIYRNT